MDADIMTKMLKAKIKQQDSYNEIVKKNIYSGYIRFIKKVDIKTTYETNHRSFSKILGRQYFFAWIQRR